MTSAELAAKTKEKDTAGQKAARELVGEVEGKMLLQVT